MAPRPRANTSAGHNAALETRETLDALDRLTKHLRDFGAAARDASGSIPGGSGVSLVPAGSPLVGGSGRGFSFGGTFGSAVSSFAGGVQSGFTRGIQQSSGLSAAETSARGLVNAAIEGPASLIESIPGIGGPLAALVRQQGRLVERGAFQPLERAVDRVGGVAGELAARGIQTSDRDLELGLERSRAQERRRLEAERRVSKLGYSTGAVIDALSYGFRTAGQ